MFRLVKRAVNTRKSVALVQRRAMSGGHGHAAPPPTGFEAKVRAIFPEDYQIVLATLGAYFGIYMSVKMVKAISSSDDEEKEEKTSGNSIQTTIPSLLDDEFEKWSKLPGNMERWEKSLETLGQ